MVYKMLVSLYYPDAIRSRMLIQDRVIYIDGACRGNGSRDARASAAACFKCLHDYWDIWTRTLPENYWDPKPTNQTAEITAVIIALEKARDKYKDLRGDPWLDITINTDSKYVIGCMTEWSDRWQRNGWVNSKGHEVANRELIEEALDLHDWLSNEGTITYNWIPRSENEVADRAANDALDEYENH